MTNLRNYLLGAYRRGALALEMAIVAPVFMVVALGIVEIGRGVMINNVVANAAHEGARTAILNGSMNDDVESSVQACLCSALGISSSDIVVEITTAPGTGRPDPTHNVANCQPGDQITVQVQVPFSRVSLLKGDYFAGLALIGSSSMRHE